MSSNSPRPEKRTFLNFHHRLKSYGLDVSRAKADGRVALVDTVFDIVRRPAGLVLKEANAADRFVLAQVEPVLRSPRDVDQIARFDLNGEYRTVFGMNVKHAAAADREANLILGVRVLLGKLGQH